MFLVGVVPAFQVFSNPLQTGIFIAQPDRRREFINIAADCFVCYRALKSRLIPAVHFLFQVKQRGAIFLQRNIKRHTVDNQRYNRRDFHFHPHKTVIFDGDAGFNRKLFIFAAAFQFNCRRRLFYYFDIAWNVKRSAVNHQADRRLQQRVFAGIDLNRKQIAAENILPAPAFDGVVVQQLHIIPGRRHFVADAALVVVPCRRRGRNCVIKFIYRHFFIFCRDRSDSRQIAVGRQSCHIYAVFVFRADRGKRFFQNAFFSLVKQFKLDFI